MVLVTSFKKGYSMQVWCGAEMTWPFQAPSGRIRGGIDLFLAGLGGDGR